MSEKPVMKPEFWEMLAEARPFGRELTAADVESWFDLKWPVYSTNGYRNHRKAIATWWGRVWEREIDEAVERRRAIEDLEETRRLEQQLAPEPEEPAEVPNHFLNLVS